MRTTSHKRAILFACVLIAIMMSAASASAEIYSGLKVGGSSTKWSVALDSTNVGLDSRTGFSAGVFGVLDWTRFLGLDLGIQVEGMYSQKGGKGILMHYLEFPALARVNVPMGSLGVHFLAGPVFAFRQNCSDCNIPIKTLDIEGLLGGGIDVGMGSGIISVEARYAKSLSGINDSTSPPTDELDIKNQGFGITLGYSRQFGGSEETDSESSEP